MSSPTEASLPVQLLRGAPPTLRPETRKTPPPIVPFWRRRVAWIDELVVPHWAPEGDTSAAIRARES